MSMKLLDHRSHTPGDFRTSFRMEWPSQPFNKRSPRVPSALERRDSETRSWSRGTDASEHILMSGTGHNAGEWWLIYIYIWLIFLVIIWGRAQPPSSFSWDTMQEITGKESRRIAMNRRTSHQISEIGMGNFSLDHDAFFFIFPSSFQDISSDCRNCNKFNTFESIF